jgi:acetyl-CoA carboxylase biotin carboxyl carrier protein
MNPLNPEDMQDLKHLIEFLKDNQVAEFELDRGDVKVRLKFNQQETSISSLSDYARYLASAPSNGEQVAALRPVAESSASAVEPDGELHIIKSPMVGTFFGSPSPGAPPFVSSGDSVDVGQEVCIIEAMKLMNPIESDAKGEVIKCFVTNNQPIEYGQPLFSVRLG